MARAFWADSAPFVDTGCLVVIRGNYQEPVWTCQAKKLKLGKNCLKYVIFSWLQPGSQSYLDQKLFGPMFKLTDWKKYLLQCTCGRLSKRRGAICIFLGIILAINSGQNYQVSGNWQVQESSPRLQWLDTQSATVSRRATLRGSI